MRAEFFQFFVQSKAGRLSRDFKEHAAGFTEIDGMKVSAIDYRCDVVAKVNEMFAPLKLFGVVLCAKGDVMYRTGRDAAHSCVGQAKQINNSARSRVVLRGKPKSVPRFIN